MAKKSIKKNINAERAVRAGSKVSLSFFRSAMNKPAVHLVLLALVAFVAYANTFNAPFQFDDVEQIEKNPVITSLDNFFSNTTGYNFNSRRFITYLTFALNYSLGGYSVVGYHIFNLAVHLINGLLVYTLVLLVFRTQVAQLPHAPGPAMNDAEIRFRMAALFSALLFTAHPIQTQAVTYIYQRLTSLTTLFYLLSIIAYIKARLAGLSAEQGSAPVKLRAAAFYLASIISAVIAMKTKEIAFTLPLMIALFEFVFFRSGFKKKMIFILPLLLTLVIIPISMMGLHKPIGELLSDISERTRVQTDMSRWDYLMTQMRVVVTYVRLIFFPAEQNLDYDYPVYHSLFDPAVFFSFVFLLSLAGLGVYFLRMAKREASGPGSTDFPLTTPFYYRLAAFGIFWFFLALSVESSFIPIVDVIFEHRVYLPSVGAFAAIVSLVFIMAAALRRTWPRIDSVVAVIVALAVLSLTAASISRNKVWGDRVSLWQDVVEKSPGKARGYNDLGNAFNRAGLLDKADEAYRKAISLDPDSYDAHNDLGISYAKSGQIDKALEEFNKAMAIKPNYARPHSNVGIIYAGMNRMDKAIEEFSKSIELDPKNSDTYKNRGLAYAKVGETGRALQDFKQACAMGNQESCEYAKTLRP
jgi:tetratricopeptide (TPR) repeat protein